MPVAASKAESPVNSGSEAPVSSGETRVNSNNSPSTPEAADVPSEPAAVPVRQGYGTIAITSEPDDAEIYVDEKFVGNAPAELKLPAGSHNIVLKLHDHVAWKRSLEVFKDSQVSLKADLDQKQE